MTSPKTLWLSVAGVAVVVTIALGSFMLWQQDVIAPAAETQPEPPPIEKVLNDDPTNFSASGTLSFNARGSKPNVPYFVRKGVNKELVFDELSFCGDATGSTPCMAMSVTFDIPFGRKPVVLEGIAEGETILVRRLRVIEAGQPIFVPEPGVVYIAWPQAIQLITECKVEGVMQAHDLTVYMTMKDGGKLQTAEPQIDDIFKVVQGVEGCGNIGLGTE